MKEERLARTSPSPDGRLAFEREDMRSTGTGLIVAGSTDPKWQGHRILLTDDVSVGRASSSGSESPHLTFKDPGMSHIHARFHVESDGRIFVSDCGSTHRTFVNGGAVGRKALRDGDVIRLGHTLLVFRRSVDIRLSTPRSDHTPTTSLVHRFSGVSRHIQDVRGWIDLVAEMRHPVLLRGDVGTGKTASAHAIHELSRVQGTFVTVDCSSLTESHAAQFLFGTPDGSEPGRAEFADRGTLYLDRVDELPESAQAPLLHLLESGVVHAGGANPRPVRAHIIASSSRSLAPLVDGGQFRADLHARLNRTIHLKPLRDRCEDIPSLAQRLLSSSDGSITGPIDFEPPRPSIEAVEALMLYEWTYNLTEFVMELERFRHRPGLIRRKDLSERIGRRSLSEVPTSDRPSEQDLRAALHHRRGNIAEVALHFAKDRRQIYRWMEHYRIGRQEYR